MGDVQPLARLVLVSQWPQSAIKSVMRALIARLRLISNGRRTLWRETWARLRCILIEDTFRRMSWMTL
jgi:hypothetical protein